MPLSSYSQSGVAQADTFFAKSLYKKAFDGYNELISLRIRDASLYTKRGVSRVYLGEFVNAIYDFDTALSIDPVFHRAYYEKGRLFSDLKEYNEALKNYDLAIQIKPLGEYFFYRGILYQRIGNLDAAMSDYTRAVEKDYRQKELYYNRSILFYKKERFFEAAFDANRAFETDTTSWMGPLAIFFSSIGTSNFSKACFYAEMALRKGYNGDLTKFRICYAADSVEFYAGLAFIFSADKLMNSQIKAYDRLLTLRPDSASFYNNRGACYYELKKYDEAVSDYLKAIELNIYDKKTVYLNIAKVRSDQNDFPGMRKWLDKVIAMDSLNPEHYVERGFAFRKEKNFNMALKDFSKALKINPASFRAYGNRARAYYDKGDFAKATEDAKRAAMLNPKYGYAHLVLGESKLKLGQKDFCEDFERAALNGFPEATEYLKNFCSR